MSKISKNLVKCLDRIPHVKVRTEEGDRPLNNTAALIMQTFYLIEINLIFGCKKLFLKFDPRCNKFDPRVKFDPRCNKFDP